MTASTPMTWTSSQPSTRRTSRCTSRGALSRRPTSTVTIKDTEVLITAFPDIHVDNDPYRATFGGGDWTCAMSLMRGSHTGPLPSPGGQVIPPTGKSFEVNFATMCRWDKNDKIAEEYVMRDAPR
jgi:hypothetical protein